MRNLLIAISFILLVGGCSSKKYYEPKKEPLVYDKTIYDNNDTIKTLNTNGATLKNYRYVSKKGLSKLPLPENFNFLNDVDGTILASDDNKTLYIKQKSGDKFIKLEENIVAASRKSNLIALIFQNNSLGLYDLSKKSIVYKEYLKESILNDIKIASPIFLDGVVLYPTLDGKVIIADLKKFQTIKTINIDPKGKINNIIYLKSFTDTLVAATHKKIFVFKDGMVYVKDYDIMNVTLFKNHIYLSTLDGTIVKLDMKLKEILKKKFKFAKFFTIAHGKKYIYALELQGYLIKLDKDLKNYTLYELPFDDEEKVTTIGNKIYFDKNYITLE